MLSLYLAAVGLLAELGLQESLDLGPFGGVFAVLILRSGGALHVMICANGGVQHRAVVPWFRRQPASQWAISQPASQITARPAATR